MQPPKFKNRHLVLENKQDVLNRIFEIAGTTNRSEIARRVGEVGMVIIRIQQ